MSSKPAPGEATRRYLKALDDREPAPIDWSAAPAPYKRYLTAARIALTDGDRIGDLLRGLLGLTRICWSHPYDETGAFVSGRIRAYPSRPAPSGGALYPIEAYAATGRALYHYDVVHHALEVVVEGDHRRRLTPPSTVPDLVVALTAVFWRTGFKYGDYAYRVQCQEVGVLAAQAHALAGRLGLRAAVHLDVDGLAADRLLDLDPAAEGTLALLTFSGPHAASPTGGPPGSGRPAPADPPPPVATRLPYLTALHAATRRRPRTRGPTSPSLPPEPAGSAMRLPAVRPVRLADGIPFRASPLNGFRPARLPLHELAQILASPWTDHPGEDLDAGAVAPYLLMLRVTGSPPGLYRYQPERHILHQVADAEAIIAISGGPLQPNTRAALRTAAAALITVGDPLAGAGRFGDLWYRIQQAEIGFVLHRATLAAHALGLTARIHSDATNPATDTALGLSATPWRSLGCLLLGAPRVDGPTRHAPVSPVQDHPALCQPTGHQSCP
ncbi:hypothetical protein [Nonomuraea sp. NPDC001699]